MSHFARTPATRYARAPDGATLVADRLQSMDNGLVLAYRVLGIAPDVEPGRPGIDRLGTAERCGVHGRRFHAVAVDGTRLTDWRPALAMCGGDCTSLSECMNLLWRQHTTSPATTSAPGASK